MTEQRRPYFCTRCRAFTRKGYMLQSREAGKVFLCKRCFDTPIEHFVYSVSATDKGKAPSGIRVLKD